MENLNLDINTYSIKELENLFKLSSNYREENVERQKLIIEKSIFNSNINDDKKQELMIFIDNIKNHLINNLNLTRLKIASNVQQYDQNHFIIENKNQLSKSTIKRSYTIDSLFRQNYDSQNNPSHNYTIDLPENITKAISMSITCIEIPLTYYNISEQLNNNKFLVNNTLVEIESGLYDIFFYEDSNLTNKVGKIIATDLIKKINDKLSDLSIDLSLSVANETGKSEFKTTEVSNQIIQFNFDNSFNCDNSNNNKVFKNYINNKPYQNLGWLLGFRDDQITVNNSNSKKSTAICSVNYPRYGYIAIDDFQSRSKNYFSIASDTVIAPNIIARINLLALLEKKSGFKQGAAVGDFLYTQKHVREYFGPTDLNKLKISLLDEYGRPLSLNNMDWSFVLNFECLYD
tara:strand:- start:213 stop:1421 length:1209 start_codon:yes stop_codon:yes gene_type:complete